MDVQATRQAVCDLAVASDYHAVRSAKACILLVLRNCRLSKAAHAIPQVANALNPLQMSCGLRSVIALHVRKWGRDVDMCVRKLASRGLATAACLPLS